MSGHIRIAAGLEERSQKTFWFQTAKFIGLRAELPITFKE